MLATLGRIAISSLRHPKQAEIQTPGPWFEASLPPRSGSLLAAYVRYTGGDPERYKNEVPPHLFPQWGFPLAARTLEGLPYRMVSVLNAGCSIESRAPLPVGEPLQVRARLLSVEKNAHRVLLTQEIVTGTASSPDVLRAELHAFIPISRDKTTKRKPPVMTPAGACQLTTWQLEADAGLDFAKLTGDFNPIHWLPVYARAAGFRSPILHGAAMFARAIEALLRSPTGGRLVRAEARFLRPLPLPREVGVYTMNDEFFLGDAAGAPSYLRGTFSLDEEKR